MKTIGNVLLNKNKVNGKELYYVKIREYNRDGDYEETEMFCRLTKKMQDLVNSLGEFKDLAIEIKDSFYSIDKYRKGEQVFTKPTLVLKDIEID